MRRLTFLLLVAVLGSLPFAWTGQSNGVVSGQGAGTTVTLSPSTVYQTMRGWEAVASVGPPASPAHPQNSFDQLASTGINRVRLEIRSGAENPVDSFADWQAAGFPESGSGYTNWRAKRYETINDNGDASSINSGGFHFSELDFIITRVVNPFRASLAARGEHLYVNLTYVSFYGQVTSGAAYVHNNANEYAEFMLAVFQHMQSRFGWVPDAVEVILEPGNSPARWPNGGQLGAAVVATGQRLAAAGFTPDFIAPSDVCVLTSNTYLIQTLAVPNVRNFLKEASYHTYCEGALTNQQTFATTAAAAGLPTSMLEYWTDDTNHYMLHDQLKMVGLSAWQQSVLAGDSNHNVMRRQGNQNLTLGPNTRYLQHYYRHVRFGARRIAATSTNSGLLDPLAFINVNGAYSVVVKATGSASFAVQGLPPGTYGIRFTTAGTTDANPGNQTIGTGGALNTSIPGAGVVTIFELPAGSPSPGTFGKISPANGATGLPLSVGFAWQPSTGATSYQYCVDTTNNNACDSTWRSAGADRSALAIGLAANTTYYWQVRAVNTAGAVEADAGAWRSFGTSDAPFGSLGRRRGQASATGQAVPRPGTSNAGSAAGIAAGLTAAASHAIHKLTIARIRPRLLPFLDITISIDTDQAWTESDWRRVQLLDVDGDDVIDVVAVETLSGAMWTILLREWTLFGAGSSAIAGR